MSKHAIEYIYIYISLSSSSSLYLKLFCPHDIKWFCDRRVHASRFLGFHIVHSSRFYCAKDKRHISSVCVCHASEDRLSSTSSLDPRSWRGNILWLQRGETSLTVSLGTAAGNSTAPDLPALMIQSPKRCVLLLHFRVRKWKVVCQVSVCPDIHFQNARLSSIYRKIKRPLVALLPSQVKVILLLSLTGVFFST